MRFPVRSLSADVTFKVHGQGNIRGKNHGIAVFAVKLNQCVLAGDGILRRRRDDSVGHAVDAFHRDTRGLGVESIDDTHLGKDFVALLHQVIAGLVGFDFGQPEICFRVEQTGIDRHPPGVEHLRVFRHFGRSSRADGGNLAILKKDDPILRCRG